MAEWGSSLAPHSQRWEETDSRGGDAGLSRHRRHTICGDGRGPPAERPRRLSAGGCGAGAAREWVTTRSTAWRAAPRADSGKIGDLPVGRRLREVPSSRPFNGWCPVAPRGFVSLEDLELVEEDEVPASPLPVRAPPSTPASASPPASSAEGAPPQRLCLEARRELEALESARAAMAGELEDLRQQREAERERVERYRRQRDSMKEKLRVCSDAVFRTVSSLDRLHLIEEEELLQPGNALASAEAEALAAGAAAERALGIISEGDVREDEEEPSEDTKEKENAPPVGAHRKGVGSEWDGVKACGKRVLAALPENMPVEDFEDSDLRAPLQQIRLRPA